MKVQRNFSRVHTRNRGGRVGALRPILEDWCRSVLAYTAKTKDDALYWYNERATLSTLAAAAARCGAVILEECRITKRRGKSNIEGRADIWFSLGRHWYVGEAKQAWPGISTQFSSVGEKLELALSSAVNAARASAYGEQYSRAIGILFCVPRLKMLGGNFDPDLCRTKVEAFAQKVLALDYDAAALAFPCHPHVYAGTTKSARYWYPGVVCLIRSVDRLRITPAQS